MFLEIKFAYSAVNKTARKDCYFMSLLPLKCVLELLAQT